MKAPYKIMFWLIVFVCSYGQSHGQVFDDWEGRPSVAVEHEFKNGIGIRARYRQTLDDNFSHYSSSTFGVKLDYKINIKPWLEPGVDYRYRYNGEEGHHDIRYFAEFTHEMGSNFELEVTPKLQQVMALKKRPEFYIRNKIELTYSISKPWSVSVFTENYQSIKGGFNFDTQKAGVGAEYNIDSSNELEFKFDVKNKSSHEDIARLTLGYTYTIK